MLKGQNWRIVQALLDNHTATPATLIRRETEAQTGRQTNRRTERDKKERRGETEREREKEQKERGRERERERERDRESERHIRTHSTQETNREHYYAKSDKQISRRSLTLTSRQLNHDIWDWVWL